MVRVKQGAKFAELRRQQAENLTARVIASSQSESSQSQGRNGESGANRVSSGGSGVSPRVSSCGSGGSHRVRGGGSGSQNSVSNNPVQVRRQRLRPGKFSI